MEDVLVVGSDTTARALLCSAFERQGMRARSAPDGVAALGLCQKLSLSALVAEPGVEGLDAFALLAALRQSGRLAKVPFLLLGGDDEDRRRALTEGAAAVLPLPIFGRDVVSLIRFLVARAPAGSLPLEEYGVLSFIRALCSARIEAQLTLRRAPSALLGEAHLSLLPQGVFLRLGHLKGRAALNRIAIWRKAQVTWHLGASVSFQKDEQVEEGAFLEAAHYLAEVQSLLKMLPPEDLPLSLVTEKAPPPDALPGEVRAILTLCEGGFSVGELLDEVPFRIIDSLRILRRLFDLGILRRPTLPQPLPTTSLREENAETEAPVVARRIVMIEEEPEEEAARGAAQTWPPGPVPKELLRAASQGGSGVAENLEERIAEALAEEEAPAKEPGTSEGEDTAVGISLPPSRAEDETPDEEENSYLQEESEYFLGTSGEVELLDDEEVVSFIGLPPGEDAPHEAPSLAHGETLGYALSVDGEEASLVVDELVKSEEQTFSDFVAEPGEDDTRFDSEHLDFSSPDPNLTPEILSLKEGFLHEEPEEPKEDLSPSHPRRRWRFWRRGSGR